MQLHGLCNSLQQPWGMRAQISVMAHGHFLHWFAFLSQLLPVKSLQLEASVCCVKGPSLVSHNRAVLIPHVGTALSGSSFFCQLVTLTLESLMYWSYWVWSSRASQQPTGHHDSHLPLCQLWWVIPSAVSLCLSVIPPSSRTCVWWHQNGPYTASSWSKMGTGWSVVRPFFPIPY